VGLKLSFYAFKGQEIRFPVVLIAALSLFYFQQNLFPDLMSELILLPPGIVDL